MCVHVTVLDRHKKVEIEVSVPAQGRKGHLTDD